MSKKTFLLSKANFRRFVMALMLLSSANASALTTTNEDHLNISGYLEGYYTKQEGPNKSKPLPDFIYNHKKIESPSINLFLLKAHYQNQNIRANLGLGSGTYMRNNYALEDNGLQNLYQANLGVSLSNQHSLWLDVGLMPSHIGFESAIGAENWTLTRSIMADNSPYYQTGAKLSYSSDDQRWLVSGLILNGWQRIRRQPGNSSLSIGHQITYKPNENITLNSSSFIGNDYPDESRRMRYFHNFYGVFRLNSKWLLMTGLDIGAEQKTKGAQSYNLWLAPILMTKFKLSDTLSITGRAEYYADPHNVIVPAEQFEDFKTSAYSLGLDYQSNPAILYRIELKKFDGQDNIFRNNAESSQDSKLLLSTAVTISF